ncbi:MULTISPECIES: hypothetical protein, partial [unclassified Nocardia]|uniref:hypothetical protein n=1 Tax=unclassified Nocardia TaxID=2637762 RepID=UPI001E3A2E13
MPRHLYHDADERFREERGDARGTTPTTHFAWARAFRTGGEVLACNLTIMVDTPFGRVITAMVT